MTPSTEALALISSLEAPASTHLSSHREFAAVLNGSGNSGTISGFDVITDFLRRPTF